MMKTQNLNNIYATVQHTVTPTLPTIKDGILYALDSLRAILSDLNHHPLTQLPAKAR